MIFEKLKGSNSDIVLAVYEIYSEPETIKISGEKISISTGGKLGTLG